MHKGVERYIILAADGAVLRSYPQVRSNFFSYFFVDRNVIETAPSNPPFTPFDLIEPPQNTLLHTLHDRTIGGLTFPFLTLFFLFLGAICCREPRMLRRWVQRSSWLRNEPCTSFAI